MRANLTKSDGQYSITTAHNVGGTRRPRTHCVALSDCVCYDADGNVTRVIPRKQPTVKRNNQIQRKTTQSTVTPTRYDSKRDLILAATMGTVHSEL